MFSVIETPPVSEPIVLADMKKHLRVDDDFQDDDALITEYMQAARELVEGATGRSMVSKGYRQTHDAFQYFIDNLNSRSAYPPQYWSGSSQWATTMWNYSQMMKLLYCPVEVVDRITYISSADGLPHDLRPIPRAWKANAIYVVGNQVTDGTNLQEVTATTDPEDGGMSTSGQTAPTWNVALNGTTTDHDLTWTNKGPAPAGDFIVDYDSEPARIFPKAGQTWPPVLYIPNAVEIHYRAGYGDGKSCPAIMRMCVRFLTGNWYENREATTPDTLKVIPAHLEDLIANARVVDFNPTP